MRKSSVRALGDWWEVWSGAGGCSARLMIDFPTFPVERQAAIGEEPPLPNLP